MTVPASLLTLVMSSLLAGVADAFVTMSQTAYGADLAAFRDLQHGRFAGPPTSTLGFLWTFPELTNDTRGLGGGITWAWDDAICPMIQPLLREDLFFFPLVRCNDLKAAMHRAFESWAANHRFISFVDVSEDCRRRYGRVTQSCDLVEVWVTVRDPSDPTLATEAARAYPAAVSTLDFRYTSGVRPWQWDRDLNRPVPRPVIETTGGEIAFTGRRENGMDICWYLDSTFCAPFHIFKQLPGMDPASVRLVGLLIVIFVTGLTVLITLLQLFWTCRDALANGASGSGRTKVQDSSSKEEEPAHKCTAVADALAKWSVCCTAVRFVLCLTPYLFYRQIFLPCFNCYDFEASAIHEIGHILGLSHPDQPNGPTAAACSSQPQQCGPGSALNMMRRPVSSTDTGSACRYSFDQVEETLEPRPSAMISFTQHNPRACLTEDDLDALHSLYPDCGHAASHIVCVKTQHNIGLVRLAVYFLVPIIVALFAAIVVGCITHRRQLQRMRQLMHHNREAAKKVVEVKRKLKTANEKRDLALRSVEDHQVQLAVNESRMQERIDDEIVRAVQACTNSMNSDEQCGVSDASGSGGCSSAMDAMRPAPSQTVADASSRCSGKAPVQNRELQRQTSLGAFGWSSLGNSLFSSSSRQSSRQSSRRRAPSANGDLNGHMSTADGAPRYPAVLQSESSRSGDQHSVRSNTSTADFVACVADAAAEANTRVSMNSQASIDFLVENGFDLATAQEALEENGGDVDTALAILLSKRDQGLPAQDWRDQGLPAHGWAAQDWERVSHARRSTSTSL